MPVHNWTRVPAGIFHDFHNNWIVDLKRALNGGILPDGYYALSEQHAGKYIADVLTLQTTPTSTEPPPIAGGVAIAEAPPNVGRKMALSASSHLRRKTLAVRHVSGHRLVALVEMVSPSNKDRDEHVAQFVGKIEASLQYGIHVLLVDLFPPGVHDPQGIHAAVAAPWRRPRTASSRQTLDIGLLRGRRHHRDLRRVPRGWANPAGDAVVPRPRLLRQRSPRKTYESAWDATPEFWRQALEDGPSDSIGEG